MDDYSRHEALHMASVFAEIIELNLCEHEVIRNNPFWLGYALAASHALQDLYQAIGEEHFDDPNNPSIKKE